MRGTAWHTLCMIDEWSSTGIGVPKQIKEPSTDVPLPMEELAFLALRKTDSIDQTWWAEEPPSPPTSLLAHMVLLNRILVDVNQLNKQAVDEKMPAPDDAAVMALTTRLDEWEAGLPAFIRDNPANLAHYAGQGLGRIFVAVYLGYYHFGQLLYYQYLHGASEDSSGDFEIFSQRCKWHAARLCNMIYSAWETQDVDCSYNMIGHVLVIASTVQIHTMLFSADGDEIAAARQRLERNFKILLRLRELWPSLDFCMMRLQAFHKACRTSQDSSFRLDRWMLKFLSEFAKPVDDKPSPSDWIIGDIAITPSSDFGFSANNIQDLIGA